MVSVPFLTGNRPLEPNVWFSAPPSKVRRLAHAPLGQRRDEIDGCRGVSLAKALFLEPDLLLLARDPSAKAI